MKKKREELAKSQPELFILDSHDIHVLAFRYLLYTVIDVPWIILSVLSLWRIFQLIPKLYTAQSRSEMKNYAGSYCIFALLDVPAAVSFVIVYLSRWHYPSMMEKLSKVVYSLQLIHLKFIVT